MGKLAFLMVQRHGNFAELNFKLHFKLHFRISPPKLCNSTLIMTSTLPSALRSIDLGRFATRAAQVEKAKPAIAYWSQFPPEKYLADDE